MKRNEIKEAIIIAKHNYIYNNISLDLFGMCSFLKLSLGVEFFSEINDIIPKFNFKFARDNFGAHGDPNGFWWDESDIDSRIMYFDYLIGLYTD